ncbi:MAG: CRISPR-associated endonuclease Cas2 [Verrucomicrobia bacterium]|nr:CRISPR-associated endonuclease Cas2 [Verrucomicrobiota bacterium]MCH8528955.1 CRISPR-associated endonuclease Cas2 [Kiritimatiellia bacterium]
MMVLVSYDVNTMDKRGQRRLRRVAKACEDYGTRVQYSVFECIVNPAQWVTFKNRLLSIFDEEVDSLRFYFLGSNWEKKMEHHGAKDTPNLESDSLII